MDTETFNCFVVSAKAGTHARCKINTLHRAWAPAFAGVTKFFLMPYCVMALLGCAALKPSEPTRVPAVIQTTLVTQFSLSGRFSAKTAAEQVSGQFRYAENGTERTLNLFSPLGTPLADIVATTGSATLTQANGSTQTAATLATLLRTVIDLPVSDAMMSAWLQGLPSASAVATEKSTERDSAGLLTRFVEGGWIIEISARMEVGSSQAFAPRRMRWSAVGVPETELRWAIDGWSTP